MDEATRWLWASWVPQGRLSMISGSKGPEKSILAAWLGTAVLRGGAFPDGQRTEPGLGPIVWLLDAASKYGPLLEHVRLLRVPEEGVRWPVDPNDEENERPAIDLKEGRWLELVAAYVPQRRPSWVVVDGLGPLGAETLRGVDRALDVFAEIAQDVGCAFTFLHDQDDRSRGSGVQGWASVVERMATIIRIKQWAPATADKQLRLVKTTFGDRPDPLRIRIDEGIPEVVRRPFEPPRYAIDRAVAYLEEQLARGPRSAFEITDRAWWVHQITPRTLQRAKGRLDVKSFKAGGRWWWMLG